jgi:hypothetical protein
MSFLTQRACPKCGTPYIQDGRGQQICRPCINAYRRKWDEKTVPQDSGMGLKAGCVGKGRPEQHPMLAYSQVLDESGLCDLYGFPTARAEDSLCIPKPNVAGIFFWCCQSQELLLLASGGGLQS